MSFLRYVEGSIPSKKLKRPASADERQVAKKGMIKNPGKENFFLNGQKIVLGWPTRNTSNRCSATGAEIIKSTECLSKEQISSNLMLSNSTKVVSHTSIINLGTTVHLKPN